MTPTRVLMEGTLKYHGTRDGQHWDWMTVRVFVLEWHPSEAYSGPYVSVVANEPMYLARIPSPAGTIHRLPAFDEDDEVVGDGQGDLLILDVDALVPA